MDYRLWTVDFSAMWLLPVFSFVARLTGGIYYRLSIAGKAVPPSGPVLLVANHPNSLLDPVLVIAAARRRVRFLAKAPLFTDPKVGWLMRAAGAIPVHRRVDSPADMSKNVDTFSAVHGALAARAAVGIFPEGLSHSEPSLTPLKTGAARIALGAAPRTGSFPIVPVGIVLRDKTVFRSRALVVIGDPIEWSDLTDRGTDDVDAVRTLTDRIDAGLRRVTVNLDDWTDAPIVECALAIWEVELGRAADQAARVGRLETTARLLREVRATPGPDSALVDEVRTFAQRLRRLRLAPRDLGRDVSARAAFRWGIQRLVFVSVPAVALAVLSFVFFFLPYRVTGRVARALQPKHDQLSTNKLMVGIAVYGVWTVSVGALVGFVAHWTVGVALVLAAVPLGVGGLIVRERWRGGWADATGFFRLRSRRRLVAELQARQRDLARRLDAVYRQRTSATHPR